MSISLQTIHAFIKQDCLLKIIKDKNGHQKLSNEKKGLWSFLAIKILKIERYQLHTVSAFISAHHNQLNELAQTDLETVDKFSKKLNAKIYKFNKFRKIENRIKIIPIIKKIEKFLISQPEFKIDQPLKEVQSTDLKKVFVESKSPLISTSQPNKTATLTKKTPPSKNLSKRPISINPKISLSSTSNFFPEKKIPQNRIKEFEDLFLPIWTNRKHHINEFNLSKESAINLIRSMQKEGILTHVPGDCLPLTQTSIQKIPSQEAKKSDINIQEEPKLTSNEVDEQNDTGLDILDPSVNDSVDPHLQIQSTNAEEIKVDPPLTEVKNLLEQAKSLSDNEQAKFLLELSDADFLQLDSDLHTAEMELLHKENAYHKKIQTITAEEVKLDPHLTEVKNLLEQARSLSYDERAKFLLELSDADFLQVNSNLNEIEIEVLLKEIFFKENAYHKKIPLIMDYYEANPWNLFFIDDNLSLELMKQWLLISEGYPICLQLLNEGIPLISNEEKNAQRKIFKKLEKSIHSHKIFNFDDLIQLHEKLKKYILLSIEKNEPRKLSRSLMDFPFLVYMIAFHNEKSRTNLQKALAYRFFEKGKHNWQCSGNLGIIESCINTLPDKDLLSEKFFKISYPRDSRFSFAKFYNKDYLSDLNILADDKILKVHRVILKSFPQLQFYLKFLISYPTLTKEELLISSAYDLFDLRNISSLDSSEYERSFKSVFNQPEDSDFRIESKSGEKIYLHKIILEASNFQYFKGLFNHQWPENLESKLVVEDDEFEVNKLVFEYLYSGVLPEFENVESKNIFEDKLKYYQGVA